MFIRNSDARGLCVISVAVSMVLSGCANPYVRVIPPDVAKAYSAVSLSYALEYSRTVHDAYRDKVIEFGDAERNLSNALITLGGVMVGLAAAKAHSSALGGATILGGTAYSLGVFNTDKRRGLVYIAGMKALECANDAVVPLNFGDETVRELQGQMSEIRASSLAVGQGIGAVEAASLLVAQRVSNAETALQSARDAVTAAQPATERASQAHVAASQLFLKHRRAGEQLRNAVQKIDAVVLDEIRGTEGAIQAVPGIISQLIQNNTIFSDLAKPPAASASAASFGQEPHAKRVRDQESRIERQDDERMLMEKLATAVAALRTETALMESRSQRLAGIVVSVETDVPVDRLKSCKVEGAETTMTITPQVLTFDEKTANTQMLLIKGGKLNYSAAFGQSSHPGLSIDASNPFLRTDVISVTATNEASANAAGYQILIRDASNQVQFVTVKVRPKADGTPNKVASDDAVVAYINTLSRLTLASGAIVTITNATVRPDGSPEVTYKPNAGKAVTNDEVVITLMADTQLANLLGANRKVVAVAEGISAPHSKKVSRVAAGRFGSTVAAFKPRDLSTVQKSLCISAADISGVWGVRTQAALNKDRERREAAGQKNVPEGFLGAAEARALLERSADEIAKMCKA